VARARLLILLAVLAARLRTPLAPRRRCPDLPVRLATGRPCPGVRVDPLVVAATRLDVRESAAWHPLGIPALLGMLAVSSGVFEPRSLESPAARRWAAAAGAV
jgi:hypothetical protein